MTTIEFPSEFKHIIIEYNKRNFVKSLELLNDVPDNEKFSFLKIKLYASIYFLTGKWSLSLKYHNELLVKEKGTYEIYNNIAVTLFNLGRIKDSIKYFNKCIEINNKFDLPYQNLGISYMHVGDYQNAIDCFANAMRLNNKNINCTMMLIDTLNYIIPKENENNFLLKLNKKVLNFNKKDESYIFYKNSEIINLINQIQEDLENDNKEIIYNKTEIFRRNSENLNCSRHFKVFKEFQVIPKYCFSCYKIQISVNNVYDLIKLFFLFNSNYLVNNNVRKCMVETRINVQENFKGFIYCRNLNEAEEILKNSKNKLVESKIDYKKIEIKHGCTEYYEKYPSFKKINFNGKQEMLYDESWKKHETKIDDQMPNFKERIIIPSVNKVNLSDILIIKNWLIYAELIGDISFKDMFKYKKNSNYLSDKLKNQINFRKQQIQNM